MRSLFVCLIAVGTATGVLAQTTGVPSFEAAAIKVDVGTGKGFTGGCRGVAVQADGAAAPALQPKANDPGSIPLGRCVISAARLSHLMAMAFDVPIPRITGLPDWDGPTRFDVNAKAEDTASTTQPQLLLMLQAFLADRFKLTVHRETQEAPAFALVVARDAPKNLHPSQEQQASMVPRGTSLVFKGYTIAELASFLSGLPAVQRPVQDQTRLDGRFDFNLDILGSAPDRPDALKMAIVQWESVFSDLQQQLGLRLDRTTASVDRLVIDHVERPSEN